MMFHHFYLESENDSPNKTKGKPRITINDILCSNIFQVNLSNKYITPTLDW